MIYSLVCGTCAVQNNVKTTSKVTTWKCNNCKNQNTTSVATDGANPILSYLLSSALLSPAMEALAQNVVDGS